jgi:chorismate lyase/3-hydroxybenzoate synthase
MTTANNAKSVHRVNSTAEQGFNHTADSELSVSLVPVADLVSHINRSPMEGLGHVLGIIGYGQTLPIDTAAQYPVLSVELPSLVGEPLAEVWHSSEKPEHNATGFIRYSKNTKLIFGCIDLDCDRDLQQQSEHVYKELLSFIENSGYPHLLRVWNHFPLINAYDGALERYQLFCVGRHNAFQAHCGTDFQLQLPAASAIGTQGSKFSLHFIASTEAGIYLENPRQTSAYQYPEQYGPCSPSFARATLVQQLVQQGRRANKLILSGTASIVGHETLHPGEPEKQLDETLRNIDTLLRSETVITRQQHSAQFTNVKVYIRHPGDLPKIKSRVVEYFGEKAAVLYLHGDICRSDLLLEIEGICDI